MQIKKTVLAMLAIAPCMAIATYAQENKGPKIDQLYVETRAGFNYENIDGKTMDGPTGFKGQYLNLRFDGQIVKGLTFSYRQRLNKNSDRTFFDATDWLHVDWSPTDRFTLSGGKQVVAIGGYEYDRAPIDLYTCSEFWNNIPCYQLGVSASYNLGKGNSLLLQACNSPFRSWMGNNSYAVNLMWYGKVGIWETMYSANMMQYATGNKWMNYIALGNRFLIANGLHVDVDLMNRAACGQTFFGKDFSVMTEVSYQPTNAVRTFAKYTYDQNKSGTDADVIVMDGTQLQMVAAGVEWNPIKEYREHLRLYAIASYNWGDNANPNGTMQDEQLKVEAGVKFRLDILEGINRLLPRR